MLGREMVDQGDFYALMFFVVGIGNLFVYGVLGWLTNIYGQVCLPAFTTIFSRTRGDPCIMSGTAVLDPRRADAGRPLCATTGAKYSTSHYGRR